jgi:hypothetical protein
MKQHLYLLLIGLFLLTVFQCTERDNSHRSLNRSNYSTLQGNKRMTPQDLERKALELDALQAETEALYHSLQAKEKLLNAKQAELDSLKSDLDKKEIELQQREKAARSTRTTGIVFLVIGIILIFLALRKMLASKDSKRASSPQPKPKPQPPISSSAGKTAPDKKKSEIPKDRPTASPKKE